MTWQSRQPAYISNKTINYKYFTNMLKASAKASSSFGCHGRKRSTVSFNPKDCIGQSPMIGGRVVIGVVSGVNTLFTAI